MSAFLFACCGMLTGCLFLLVFNIDFNVTSLVESLGVCETGVGVVAGKSKAKATFDLLLLSHLLF